MKTVEERFWEKVGPDTERVKRSNDKMSTKRALSPILEETSVTVSVTGGSLCGRNS